MTSDPATVFVWLYAVCLRESARYEVEDPGQ